MTDSTQLSDAYLLDSSLKSDPELRVSRAKKIVTLTDNNQGSYTGGLITIDGTTQLNGSQGFAALKEGYLTLPYVVTAKNTGTQGFSAPLSRFACSLKTGVWNVISDLEVELNGKSILTSNDYKSFWANIRAATETSVSDMYKHAADTNLYPDDWFSINYTNTSSPAGDGYSNNQSDTLQYLDSTLGQTQENRACNSGFVSKLNNASLVIDNTTNSAFSWPTLQKGAVTNIVQQTGRGGFIETTTASAGAIAGTWIHMLKIRLTDLHPLFKDLDLVANPQLKLKLRVNAGTVAVDMQRIDSAPTLTSGSSPLPTAANTSSTLNGLTLGSTNTNMSINNVTFSSGSVVPIMISSGANGQPMSTISSTIASQISFSFGALRNAFTDTSSIGQYLPYTVTRLNVPFYDLIDPRPIVSKPLKTIKYLDAYAAYYKGQCGLGVSANQMNAPFDVTIGPTFKNIKYVAVIPFAEPTGLYATATNVEQFQSPFDSAPYTCLPGASVRNFQVQIGSENVFKKTHEYDYETFLDEFSKLGAINGDVVREMNTGLVDFARWSYAQRVMVADCSRVSEKDVPASVRVSFINNCCQGMNVLVLIVRERELTIDRLTGEVESYTP